MYIYLKYNQEQDDLFAYYKETFDRVGNYTAIDTIGGHSGVSPDYVKESKSIRLNQLDDDMINRVRALLRTLLNYDYKLQDNQLNFLRKLNERDNPLQ
jgi:hypothetical protein